MKALNRPFDVLIRKVFFGLAVICLLVFSLFNWATGEDRLVVKDSSGNTTFRVEDIGFTHSSAYFLSQCGSPGIWMDETGTGNKSAFFVLDQKWFQIQRRAQGFGDFEASPFYLNIDAPSMAFVVAPNGYVGLNAYPVYPLQLGNGAYVTAGGVWTNASSRQFKKDIQVLSSLEAMETLEALRPVKFQYKNSPEERHVGFIAEEVPDLVAAADRKGMSAMDVVAVLTKVVQQQQKMIHEMSKKIEQLENNNIITP